MRVLILFLFSIIPLNNLYSQNDSINENYYNNLILYSDLGYYSCPFDIKLNQFDKLKFRNNIKPFIGIGGCYKWGSIRIGTLINYNIKGLDNYGSTKVFKIGTEITYKNYLIDLSYYKLNGYTLLTNEKLNISKNMIYDDLSLLSTYLNATFFLNKRFSNYALKGIKQSIKKNIHSFYFKTTTALINISNSNYILPEFIIKNSNMNSYNLNRIYSFEIGLIPGIAFAFKQLINYQIGGMFGYGGVINDRYVDLNYSRKNFIGLSPRFDFHLYMGYNVKKYFLMNYLDIEKRNIDFTNFNIIGNLISYRLVAGYRF